jgi:SAM-dependent methyltransferase
VADHIFEHPRLAAIYDAIDPDRSDLDVYAAIVAEFGAQRVLDVGCGTGAFALLLADRGVDVVGVDPAGASLAVARAKPGAQRVRWLHGDAAALPLMQVDLATMTANVAQADGWCSRRETRPGRPGPSGTARRRGASPRSTVSERSPAGST